MQEYCLSLSLFLFLNKIFQKKQNLEKDCFVGCDPQLISINEWKEWKETLEQANKQLIPIHVNLIDILWDQQRPQLPNEPIWKHELQFSGKEDFHFILF